MKKIKFSFILFFCTVCLFAAPQLPSYPKQDGKVQSESRTDHHDQKRYRNFHGKRFVNEAMEFRAVIIRTFDISDMVLMEVLFNNPIDSNSIQQDCITINEKPVDLEKLRFSRNRNSFRLIFLKTTLEENCDRFSFCLQRLKSVNGNEIIPVKLDDCILSAEYRFSEKERSWKKF